MATNRKSLKYLTSGLAKSTAHNILNSTSATQFHTNHHLSDPPHVYDDKLQSYTNYDEKYKSNLNAAENITNHSSLQSVRFTLWLTVLEFAEEASGGLIRL